MTGEQRPPVHWPTFHRDSCGRTIGALQSDIAALVTCDVCLSQAELHKAAYAAETVEGRRDPDGLPVAGSKVKDRVGDVWTQGPDHRWRINPDGPGVTWYELEQHCGPLRLL